MNETVAGVTFFSDFDSGNLARVEEVNRNTQHTESVSNVRPKSACAYANKEIVLDSSNVDIFRKRARTFLSTKECSNLSKLKAKSCELYTLNRSDSLNSCGEMKLSPSKSKHLSHVREFNLWTKQDCLGTPFENANRTWFYFGVRTNTPNLKIRLNIMNLNKQNKLMSQGMAPVFKQIPGQETWQRILDKPRFSEDDKDFILSFDHELGGEDSITYYAFTYPFSYTDCQEFLSSLDMIHGNGIYTEIQKLKSENEIYFCRQLLCLSNEARRVDLLTISSCKGLLDEREDHLPDLFPDNSVPTSHKFQGKKIIFISSRVHPGETQSSFVLNGFIKFILTESDARAAALRDTFVFKIVPFLNPDGVFHGHYRTDLQGVNLNRIYLNCNFNEHPSIFATRSLILYYHWEYSDVQFEESTLDILEKFTSQLEKDNIDLSGDELSDFECPSVCSNGFKNAWRKNLSYKKGRKKLKPWQDPKYLITSSNSGLAFFIDLHGHASKRGCFLFGNYFNQIVDKTECMLLAKLMSLNNAHFDFAACNFSAQNMTQKGSKDRLSKEGSARVATYYLTKIIHSYTFECNFNMGRMVNVLPPIRRDGVTIKSCSKTVLPKYTPKIFEEVGKALAISILDTCDKNPYSRLKMSVYHDLDGVKDWLMQYLSGGKTVSAWRHPQFRHWNSFKRSSSLAQSFLDKSIKERSLSPQGKYTTMEESIKLRNLSLSKQRRASVAISKIGSVKLKKPEVSICVSNPDKSSETLWLLPNDSISSVYSAKHLSHVKKSKKGIASDIIRCKGMSAHGGSKESDCSGEPQLYIFGTRCRQIHSNSINV